MSCGLSFIAMSLSPTIGTFMYILIVKPCKALIDIGNKCNGLRQITKAKKTLALYRRVYTL